MKKVIYSLFVFLNLIAFSGKSQVFWTETFGFGCSAGNLATAGPAPTPSNGLWVVTSSVTPYPNGPDANEWFISATEQGLPVGTCGAGCGGGNDRTLHLGSNILVPIPIVDPGAAYLAGPTSFTNKRAESPIISTVGKQNIQLSFTYLAQGIPLTDFCTIEYFDGTWKTLTPIAPSNNGLCAPQGTWSFFAVGLPPSCNNIPNLQIAFHWFNSDLAGADPSIAIDNIQLATMTINMLTSIPCPGQTVVATVGNNPPGVTGYTWTSLPPTVVFTPSTSIPTTVTFPGPGVYTVALFGSTLPGGIPTATAITTVTVNASLPLVTSPPQTVCPGSTATLTASGATTYSWSVGINGPPIGNGSSVTVTCPTPSVVNYFVQGTQGACISNSILTQVTYTNIPLSLTITPVGGVTVCPSGAINLTASGATNYTWTIPGNTATPTGAILTDTPTATGVYTVNGDNGGCTGTQTVNVTVQNIPLTLTLAPTPATICVGQTVALSATGANNYTWTPFSSLSSSVGTPVNASPSVTTTYNVLGEAGGCTGNAQITVTIAPGPNLLINATAFAVCAGYTSTITASGAMTYTWTGTTFTSAINQPSISMGAGIYTVVASSTAFACPTMSAVTINTMAPLQIGGLQSSFTTCISNNYPVFSKPVLLNATGGSTYNWSPCVGGFLTSCIGHSTIARPLTTTQYTVTGFTSVCSGSFVITVTVIPQSTINVQPPMPIACLGGCFNFTVINTNTTLPLPYTYNWGVPNPLVGSVDNVLAPSVIACPTVSGTYTVELKDGLNCVTQPRLVSATIIPQPISAAQIPTINGVPTNSVCFVGDVPSFSNTLTLCAQNMNGTLQAGVIPTYTWYSFSSPSNSLMNEGSIITPTSDACPIIQPWEKLPAVITYTLRSGFNGNGGGNLINGCFREDTVSVRIVDCRPVRLVTFTTTVTNDTICTKQCLTYTNTTDAGGPQTFTWTFEGGSPKTTSIIVAPTVCYNLPGKWDVFLTVGNQYGPAVATSTYHFAKVVDVPNTTIIAPGMMASDTTIRFGMSVNLTGSGADWYTWSPPYMISNLTGNKTTVSPHQTVQYVLTGYYSNGCASNDTINVIVIDDCGQMFVPNAFSPNGHDNPENETLKVYGYCMETLTFQVFNRWGQKVFETTDQKIGWDGTFNGDELNSGVFVYRLEGKGYNGEGYSLKGNVTLIR